MKALITAMPLFGLLVSILFYMLGLLLKRRVLWINPLLFSIVSVVLFLRVFHIGYTQYSESAKVLPSLLPFATVCLALPLYERFSLLLRHWKPILGSLFLGVILSLGSVAFIGFMGNLSREQIMSLMPKSVTTAIGMGISAETGGSVPVTVCAILATGIFGSIIAEPLFRILRITSPIAKGVALGNAAHAIGTAKAFEIGECEGAMSSLSLALSGILTVFLVPLVAVLW